MRTDRDVRGVVTNDIYTGRISAALDAAALVSSWSTILKVIQKPLLSKKRNNRLYQSLGERVSSVHGEA